MKRRVVVTGMGVISPIGETVDSFAHALFEGRSGVGPITVFDPASLPTRIAAEVQSPCAARDRKVAFAIAAAAQAMENARAAELERANACACFGVGLELFSMDDLATMRRPGFELPSSAEKRATFLQAPSDTSVHRISASYSLGRPPIVLVSACAAGTDAIGTAFRLVRSGRRDWVLAGGADSMINPLGVAGFCTLMATSTRNDAPTRASRPFDRTRDGFVLGEGAAALVIESLESAHARGAPIHAELLGYGTSFDAHGISEPHPEGRGALQAMSGALADARLDASAIDAINAHGTGTPKNDPVETLAIKRLLGARAKDVPVCATKSMIGHLISAAGAVEAIAAITCMKAGVVHPNPTLEEPDPACDLDYVAGTRARPHRQRVVLSSSFAFGGQNASIVIGEEPG